MGLIDDIRRKNRRSARRPWWETAAEFPADELFYDPTISDADHFDPMGSYTGKPVGGGQPQQDADDL